MLSFKMNDDYTWITGADADVTHLRLIGSGITGDVHGVSHSLKGADG